MRLNQVLRSVRQHLNPQSKHAKLVERNWMPTTVDNEYKNDEAPGFSIEIDLLNRKLPYVIYRGCNRFGRMEQPPTAAQLMSKVES
jgi:hypothetical protein